MMMPMHSSVPHGQCARSQEGYPPCIKQCEECHDEFAFDALAVAFRIIGAPIIAAVLVTIGQIMGFTP